MQYYKILEIHLAPMNCVVNYLICIAYGLEA